MSTTERDEFPKPRRNEGGEPCGECHVQPGETCDICGAVNAAASPSPASPAEGLVEPEAELTPEQRRRFREDIKALLGVGSPSAADDVAGLLERAKVEAQAFYSPTNHDTLLALAAALSRLQAREKDLSDALVGAREERDQCKRDAEALASSAATMREALTAAREELGSWMLDVGEDLSADPTIAKIDAALGGQHG